ncbi:MAG: coproporphyrinogen-III oxidase family protein [Synechococcaceae cyanobacterium]|nr:coproporphyrinogen-III oxidase family protein [Synechococcaceae cyanobacterium]
MKTLSLACPVQHGPRSAYVHLPFCHRRCFYCDFPVVPLGDRADGGRSASVAAYLQLLEREIRGAPAGPPLATVYIGGGTPSLLTPAQISGVLAALRLRYGFAPGAEITLELDPASFDQERLEGYLAGGVNRVSLGGQSFDDAVLVALGRRHGAADLRRAAGWLRQALGRGDLRSWSLDLIQGIPLSALPAGAAPPLEHWRAQLHQAIALGAPHLSVYDLTIEPGTVFDRRLQQGLLPLPDADLAADLHGLTWTELRAGGYGHYEISSYAWPGHASRHNRVYWSGAGWWGFGMGATSALQGDRQSRPRTREAYRRWLEAGGVAAQLQPGALQRPMPLDERLMVGLRRREGVHIERLRQEYGLTPALLDGLQQELQSFIARGLLLVEGPRWRLADPEGLALSNAVLREMLGWWQEQGLAPQAGPVAVC